MTLTYEPDTDILKMY